MDKLPDTKPAALKRLHVAAHHGHLITDCPLCREYLDRAVISAVQNVAAQLQALRSDDDAAATGIS